VIAGVLSPGFGDALAAAQDFKRAGADAIMLVTPFYARPTQDGMRGYFNEFCSRVDLPLVLYDIPYRTGVSIGPATVRRLAEENPKIIGMKACSTDLAYFTRLISEVEDTLSLLSGEEYLFLSHMILGAKGGILATCNVFPHAWIKMYKHIVAGDIPSARRILFRLVPLLDAVFAEMNPGPLKEAMSMVGHDVGPAMRPLVKPSEKTMVSLKAAVEVLIERPV
jgi:4-hydroxy-tetrahydrodipicolinate synthase